MAICSSNACPASDPAVQSIRRLAIASGCQFARFRAGLTGKEVPFLGRFDC